MHAIEWDEEDVEQVDGKRCVRLGVAADVLGRTSTTLQRNMAHVIHRRALRPGGRKFLYIEVEAVERQFQKRQKGPAGANADASPPDFTATRVLELEDAVRKLRDAQKLQQAADGDVRGALRLLLDADDKRSQAAELVASLFDEMVPPGPLND